MTPIVWYDARFDTIFIQLRKIDYRVECGVFIQWGCRPGWYSGYTYTRSFKIGLSSGQIVKLGYL